MPKMKTHKGLKKRFKVSANGKVMHKPCGSSHLNSHKNGKQIRRLRKKKALKVTADARRIRTALRDRQSTSPAEHEAVAALIALEQADGVPPTPPASSPSHPA